MEKSNQSSGNWVERLDRYEASLPEGTWNKILAKRKDKSKAGLIWLLAVGLGALVAGAFWWSGIEPNTSELKTERNSKAHLEKRPAAPLASETDNSESGYLAEKMPKGDQQNNKTGNKPGDYLVKNKVVEHENHHEILNQKSFGGEVETVIEPELHQPGQSEVKVSAESGALLHLTSLPGLVLSPLDNPAQDIPRSSPDPCFPFSKKSPVPSKVYIELLGGFDMPFKHISQSNASDDLDYYLTARDSSEQDWYAFSGQVGIGMQYENGLSIRTGLHYLQINEIFEYSDATIIRTIQVELKDSDGNVIGTQTVVEEGYRYVKTHNRLCFFDLPLQLGWEKNLGKFQIGLYGGATLNLLFQQKGAFFSETLEPVSFTSASGDRFDYFKTKAGLTATANLSIGYQLTSRLSWRLEPQFRYQLAPLNKTLLDQDYRTVGLWTGLRYDLWSK